VGGQVPLSAPDSKRLMGFGLDLIQPVNLVLDLMDAPDRSGPASFFEVLV
jgi:hypothetical protein